MSTFGLIYGKKELTIEGIRIDIFAIGQSKTPYIIEIKKNRNRHIVGQAIQYLLLVQKFTKQVEKEMNDFEINWNFLKILCIAPDFYENDLMFYEQDLLKERIHFYKLKLLKNENNQIQELFLEYFGPNKSGPLLLLKNCFTQNNLIELTTEYYAIKNTAARRNYYNKNILSIFNDLDENFIKYSNIKVSIQPCCA